MLQLNFSPFPELKTKRLLLRKLDKTDAKEIFFLRSNEDVLRYLGREPTATITEAGEFIGKINKGIEENEAILWGIALLENPSVVIGTICLWNIQKENLRAEIGYMLHPDFWGKVSLNHLMASAIFIKTFLMLGCRIGTFISQD